MENIIESTVNAEPVENVEPQQEQVTEPTKSVEKVEVAEQPKVEEKPVQSKEENAKYAAIRREAEQKAAAKAQDELIASMYGESHGIYTKADYDKAVQKANEEAEIQKAIDKGTDPEVARELAESRKFRREYQQEQLIKKEQEKQQQDFQNFMKEYPQVKAEEIPSEVWEEVNKGKSLVDAYTKHENLKLKAQLEELKKGVKTQEINSANAATSTGSVTGNGKPVTKEITAESIATMSEKEISQNWAQVKKILNMR